MARIPHKQIITYPYDFIIKKFSHRSSYKYHSLCCIAAIAAAGTGVERISLALWEQPFHHDT
jgi:hypothetical protein